MKPFTHASPRYGELRRGSCKWLFCFMYLVMVNAQADAQVGLLVNSYADKHKAGDQYQPPSPSTYPPRDNRQGALAYTADISGTQI